jgi:hypothetical protein
MEERLRDVEDTVDELQEEVRFLRSEVRALRRDRRTAGGSERVGEEGDSRGQSQASERDSLGSFSVVRSFNEDASRSRTGDPEQGGYVSGARSPTPSTTSAAVSTT